MDPLVQGQWSKLLSKVWYGWCWLNLCLFFPAKIVEPKNVTPLLLKIRVEYSWWGIFLYAVLYRYTDSSREIVNEYKSSLCRTTQCFLASHTQNVPCVYPQGFLHRVKDDDPSNYYVLYCIHYAQTPTKWLYPSLPAEKKKYIICYIYITIIFIRTQTWR